MASIRSKVFSTIVYPESAPSDFVALIEELAIPAFVSPLHDSDFNKDGTPKKAHHHVMLMFDGVKTEDQARHCVDYFGGVGCEIVKSTRAYARYLCHLDSPSKHLYATADVIALSGADYSRYNVRDEQSLLLELLAFVRDNNILSFSDLVDYSLEYHPDYFPIIRKEAYFIREYLKSRTWTISENISSKFKKGLDNLFI